MNQFRKPISLDLPDCELLYWPEIFSHGECDELLEALTNKTQWNIEQVWMYHRKVLVPRQTAWFGDAGAMYSFAGIRREPQGWFTELAAIKQRVEELTGSTYNSVLLNRYRDGQDSVAWHSDDEPELQGPIASVSLGGVRTFKIKHKTQQIKHDISLAHGSLLLMGGSMQDNWIHAIPKTKKYVEPRINLTFRTIKQD